MKTLGFSGLVFGIKTLNKSVSFEGRVEPWTIHFRDVGSITISAALAMKSELANGARTHNFGVEGRVSFDGFSDNEFFQHFSMAAKFDSGKSQVIEIILALGDLDRPLLASSGRRGDYFDVFDHCRPRCFER